MENTFKYINAVGLHTICKTDLTKHFMLKPVRFSAECYDKHFAFSILKESHRQKVKDSIAF